MADAFSMVEQLEQTLLRIANRDKRPSGDEMPDLREQMSHLARSFNGNSAPTVERLAQAIPDIADFSALWSSVNLMTRLSLEDPTLGARTADVIIDVMRKDPGTSTYHMAAAKLRDVAVAHPQLAQEGAQEISKAFLLERDDYTATRLLACLIDTGHASADAAVIAVEAMGKKLCMEKNLQPMCNLAGHITDIATKHPEANGAAIEALGATLQGTDNKIALGVISRNLVKIAYDAAHPTEESEAKPDPSFILPSIQAITAAIAKTNDFENASTLSSSLGRLSAAHPAAVGLAIEETLDATPQDATDKRRTLLVTLGSVFRTNDAPVEQIADILRKEIVREANPYNKKLIAQSLLSAARHGDGKTAASISAIQTALQSEAAQGTDACKEMREVLHALGDFKKFTAIDPVLKTQVRL